MTKRSFSMEKIKKAAVLFILTVLAVTMLIPGQSVRADMPYVTYSYDYWEAGVYQPQAYLYSGAYQIMADELKLTNPEDMFVTDDAIYIADTGNSRILKLSPEGEVLQCITHASNEEDTFARPKGIYITPEKHIYVADTDNARIVELDENGAYVRQFGRPVTDLIDDSQIYAPTKVVVDSAGRIYVIAYGINMGLVEFNPEGEFQGFLGAAQVSVSTFEYIWKNYFSTEEQKKRMQTIVPTEYSNVFMDKSNFIYATISNLDDEDLESGADAIRRLNPTGTDVLRRLGNYDIIGDLYRSSADAEWSVFTDVCATDFGCYYILDSANGRVFTYDYDGNSLFIFGDAGSRAGMMKNPKAIGLSPDEERIYVLDAQLESILTYDLTDYGRHFLNALKKNNIGDAQGAYEEWQEVLARNANCELAYIGVGKTFLKRGEYKKAMEYFKLGNSRKYYSTAFFYYRKESVQEAFPTVMLVIGIVLGAALVVFAVIRLRRWVGEVRCFMQDR